MNDEITDEITDELNESNESNIQCILNEQDDYPFYDAEFILSQFNFENSSKDDSDKDSEESEESCELDQLSLFDKTAKQLVIICEYYKIVKTKLKKQEIIEKILLFENNPENKNIMKTRYKIWKVMDQLKMDNVMKKYIIWI